MDCPNCGKKMTLCKACGGKVWKCPCGTKIPNKRSISGTPQKRRSPKTSAPKKPRKFTRKSQGKSPFRGGNR